MGIYKNISATAGAVLAAGGSVSMLNSSTMSLTAYAAETHDQNTSTAPSVGDNTVNDPAKVSTSADAYKDIQGDKERDTNAGQHSSTAWEYLEPNQAADAWKQKDDTRIEPGTDNTQTDWNIATGTNGKSGVSTSANVTGDSSENKFNPGNVYNPLGAGDKTASVREDWPTIQKRNQAYDDFIRQYGSYYGPLYWTYFNTYGYLPENVVVNNNNNSSNNNNGLNGNSQLNGTGTAGTKKSSSSTQNSTGQGSTSSSSSSSSTVGSGIGLAGAGVGAVSNNNNNNNNNNNSNNNIAGLTSSDSNSGSTDDANKPNDPNKEKDDDKDNNSSNESTPDTAPTTGDNYDVGGVVDAAVGLPQTGNVRIQKSSMVGAGLVVTTLTAMGVAKLSKK